MISKHGSVCDVTVYVHVCVCVYMCVYICALLHTQIIIVYILMSIVLLHKIPPKHHYCLYNNLTLSVRNL